MLARWWLWPLAIALVIDLGLVARHQFSAGSRVNRAAVRTAAGNSCEESVLVRESGLDAMFVVDTWRGGSGQSVVSATAQVAFAPGQGFTPQSAQQISEGLEVGSPSPVPLTQLPLTAYRQQVRQGQPWVQAACAPYANPYRSHLSAIGAAETPDGPVTVYHGRLHTSGARGEFPLADVWVALRPDGRLGFEVMRDVPVVPRRSAASASGTTAPTVGSSTGAVLLAQLFRYPSQHLDSLAKESARTRAAFYVADYQDLLQTMAATTAAGKAGAAAPPSLASAVGPSSTALSAH